MDLKSVPIAPSLVTLGNVFCGFLAMAKAADAVWLGPTPTAEVLAIFDVAVMLIFVAMVLDAVDGRVARMTNQTTPFGAQLDSLADAVTFGVAPALVAKLLINFYDGEPGQLLPPHPKLYYFCAAVYVLCAVMRLARFNVETEPDESAHQEFKGIPTPGAAALVCAMVAFFVSRNDESNVITNALLPSTIYDSVVVAMPAVLVCLGLLMVSKVPYPHAAYALIRRRHSFPFLVMLVLVIGLAAIEWQLALLVITVGYTLSGLLLGGYRLLTRGHFGPPGASGGAGKGGADKSGANAGAVSARDFVEPRAN